MVFLNVFFSSLSLLSGSRFYCFFVVLFGSLSFLLGRWLSGFFMVLFSSLGFLSGSFFVFLMVRYFCSRCFSGSWRSGGSCRSSSRSGSSSVSSESGRRQTHSSGNNQS
ncbi:Uncharacterised protein [Cedecea davisae]|nr:Uncharacterised protein [Cedecea davisae]